MLSLETLGRRGALFAIADWRSRQLARLVRQGLAAVGLAAHAAVAPRWLPGANSSDHWSFWRHGSPAVMLTDASAWRHAHYHRRTDRADLIDYAFLAAAVHGVSTAVALLTRLVA